MPAIARWNACECRLAMPGTIRSPAASPRQPSGVHTRVGVEEVMRAFSPARARNATFAAATTAAGRRSD
ncbi:hypothetical protein [Lysobacter gummosus]|uniref:hypothetical protein n=1 Tax=Lysobacter gummosus TaxID=262324 RepID=UPI00363B476F